MARNKRRQTPEVKDGRVQKKDRHVLTPNYWSHAPRRPVIDKERPGIGNRHYLRKNDVFDFIEILPEWDELARGLRAVLLAEAEDDCDGWYEDRGVVAICAWTREKWITISDEWYLEHKELLKRLGVDCQKQDDGWVTCKFGIAQIRAYQLLHVFLHELGHHHDRITTKFAVQSSRGECYAEQYAFRYEKQIWNNYVDRFGLPEWGDA